MNLNTEKQIHDSNSPTPTTLKSEGKSGAIAEQEQLSCEYVNTPLDRKFILSLPKYQQELCEMGLY